MGVGALLTSADGHGAQILHKMAGVLWEISQFTGGQVRHQSNIIVGYIAARRKCRLKLGGQDIGQLTVQTTDQQTDIWLLQ